MDAEKLKQALTVAYRMLSRRDHSEKEIRDRLLRELRKKGLQEGALSCVVEAALTQLREAGYTDDRRFAQVFLKNRAERGDGPLKIRYSLREKGVSQEDIDHAIEACEIRWIEVAQAAGRRKVSVLDLTDRAAQARLYRYLAQKGFPAEVARSATEDFIQSAIAANIKV